ncbi:MAG: hypothetical protein HYT78_00320 [Deltaproteobacteria bacterium]|nr:hypothetical protein [Deltaproteobacteria bacterium]
MERLIDAALAGASAVREGRPIGPFRGSRKADGSLVTDSDYTSQAAIIDAIHKNFPGADILAEEHPYSFTARGLKRELLVVDPLDGTTNFTLGLTIWAISIALFQDCELVAGVVVQPDTGDLYYARVLSVWGGGAVIWRMRSSHSSTILLTQTVATSGGGG